MVSIAKGAFARNCHHRNIFSSQAEYVKRKMKITSGKIKLKKNPVSGYLTKITAQIKCLPYVRNGTGKFRRST